MKMRLKNIGLAAFAGLVACGGPTLQSSEQKVSAGSPVTVTAVSKNQMYTEMEFNAYSKYLQKVLIRSPVAGFITHVSVKPGDRVLAGQKAFVLQTQEARALQGLDLKNDSLLQSTAPILVKSPQSGIISTVSYQVGAFVQQGEQLADALAQGSIVFVMNVPFEHVGLIKRGAAVQLQLPGHAHIKATMGDQVPTAKSTGQVTSFILRPDTLWQIPENLNVTVLLQTDVREGVPTLPKEAILTDETQTKFWVMKLLNDTTAVKVDVQKGQETDGLVEIVKPAFSENDRILLTGQYGLSDTANVKLEKP